MSPTDRFVAHRRCDGTPIRMLYYGRQVLSRAEKLLISSEMSVAATTSELLPQSARHNQHLAARHLALVGFDCFGDLFERHAGADLGPPRRICAVLRRGEFTLTLPSPIKGEGAAGQPAKRVKELTTCGTRDRVAAERRWRSTFGRWWNRRRNRGRPEVVSKPCGARIASNPWHPGFPNKREPPFACNRCVTGFETTSSSVQ